MKTVSSRTLATMLTGWRDAGVAYVALADRIRLLLVDGRMSPGTRIPAERELAGALDVSRTTVSAAYAALRESGHLTSLRGSGSVAQLPFAPIRRSEDRGHLDFSKATMPAIPGLADATRRAGERLPAYFGESGFDPLGLPVLRAAIADRYTSRGLPTAPEQVMVTLGALHAIALIARTVMSRGDRAVIESPTYPNAMDALRAAGARLESVPVTTEHGWEESALEQIIRRANPALAYLMPDFHNPTGRSMPRDQCERVLALAAQHGTTVIADETLAELGFDESRVPFAAYGPAVLVGSVGKTVWGGMRLGWIRADRTVIQRLARERSSHDLGTPVLEQLVLVELLGRFDEILAERREYLAAGHARLVSLLTERLPDWHLPRVRGGGTLWVGLGHPVSSQLALAARAEGLVLAAGPRFGMDGAFERFTRVPFCLPAVETERGVDALAAAWASVSRSPARDAIAELDAVVL